MNETRFGKKSHHMETIRCRIDLRASVTIGIAFALLNASLWAAQATTAPSNFTFPDTPAARQLQAWLTAYNSGDRASIQSFVQRVMRPGAPSDFVDQTIQMRDSVWELRFQKIQESTDLRLVALAHSRATGELVRFSVEVEAAAPHRIASISLEPASPPTNTPPPPEMTASEAAAARTQPSYRQFAAWLAAFNMGDGGQYRQFLETNFPSQLSRMKWSARLIAPCWGSSLLLMRNRMLLSSRQASLIGFNRDRYRGFLAKGLRPAATEFCARTARDP